MNPLSFNNDSTSLYFHSLFSALHTLFGVLDSPASVSANIPPVVVQALRAAQHPYTLVDIDDSGIAEEVGVAVDYAGIFPAAHDGIKIWAGSAGWLDHSGGQGVEVIDLTTLSSDGYSPGALIRSEDESLIRELRLYGSLGIEKGSLWNDRIEGSGIDALMSPLAREYWKTHTRLLIERVKEEEETVMMYRESLQPLKQLSLSRMFRPTFFPLKLSPELYCPKEDIYTALSKAGIAVEVPYKPIYRYRAFEAEKLRGCEEFYKSVLALPVRGVEHSRATDIVHILINEIEHYGYRGCSF